MDNIILKQRGKTVFCHKIYVKKENLTKEGYFDLKRIPSLRIIDNNILKKIRDKYNKTHNEIALLAKVPIRTEIGWESYKKALPFNRLLLICNGLGLKEKKIYELIKNSEFTFGNHHGKNRIRLPLKPDEFKIANYLIPLEPEKVYVIKNTPKEIKNKIISDFSVDNYYLKKSGLLTIYSYLLYEFLKTFYYYKKELLLKFPLTDEIPFWINQKVDITKAVIIPLLLTDGGEKPACVFISGESNIVHNIWSDACYYGLNKLPSSYKLPYKSIFVTSHRLSLDALEKIKKICPNFKTAPRNEPLENYQKLLQPTISYLHKISKLEQQIALRLWAITEGSISIHNSKSEKLITPNLRIACAHPNLTKELREIAKNNEITPRIKPAKEPNITPMPRTILNIPRITEIMPELLSLFFSIIIFKQGVI